MATVEGRRRARLSRRAGVLLAAASVLLVWACADRVPPGYVEHRHLVLEAGRARVLPSRVVVRPGEREDRELRGRGWGDGELDPGRGERFAWVVGHDVELEIEHSGRQPATLEVRGWPYTYAGAPAQRLTAVVNGVECSPVDLAPGGFDVTIPVPEGSLVAGANTLMLRFEFAEAPAERDPKSRDGRPLAAAITEIVLSSEVGGAVVAAGGTVRVEGQDLVVAPAAVAVFRLRVPESALLVADRMPVGEFGTGPSGGLWVRRAGETSVRELVARGRGSVVSLAELSGELVEIGFEGGPLGTRWREPVLWVPPTTSRPANVVLIVVDTLRADVVGAYGGAVATPAIDGLAARGVLFERTWSHIPITGPSHSSLFTALLPYEHGVRNNSQILPESAFTLAESMQASGRTTAAVVSLGVLRSNYGFAQGFEHYGDDFDRDWMKNAAEVNREVLAWLGGVGDAPYFLFVHYSDPHEPYAPPTRQYPRVVLRQRGSVVGEVAADGRGARLALHVPPGTSTLQLDLEGERAEYGFRFPSIRVADDDVRIEPLTGWEEREKRFGPSVIDSALPATLRLVNTAAEARDVELELSCKEKLGVAAIRERYAEEVAFVDGRISELLAALEERGDLGRTLVVLTADHGEGLGDHNHVGHISQLYDTLIRVPLVLAMPGELPEGVRVSAPASLVDVFPTLADLLGLDPPQDPHGVSLLPSIRGNVLARAIIAETYRPEAASDKRALIEGGHKLITSRSDVRDWQELYDLDADPGEADDLAELDPERMEAMARRLDEILASYGSGGPAIPREAPLSEEEKAQLRALGYLRE